jgi:Tol biopolymer transport system component
VIDERDLEQAERVFTPPDGSFDRFLRRRDRKRRNRRISAGVVGIAVFVAAVWAVTAGGSLDRSETPAVSGSAETGPAVSNCLVTRCTQTGPAVTPPARTIPEAYLIDLNTGDMTPLPESIGGGYGSWEGGYTVSPDGTMVAYASPDDTGTRQVFIANLDGTDVQQVTHDRRGTIANDWSPDGAAIAYTSGENTPEGVHNIFVLDLATGETSQLTHEKPPTDADVAQFSPDGASIVHDLHRGDSVGVWIVPVTGGKSVRLVGGGENGVEAWTGTLSPDGSTLAAGCFGRLQGICIAGADGTKLRVLVSGPSLYGPRWSPDGTRIAYNSQATGNKVFVVEVATGETTVEAEGVADDWLDDHTLIVECVCH